MVANKVSRTVQSAGQLNAIASSSAHLFEMAIFVNRALWKVGFHIR